VPSRIAASASSLYARNLYAFAELFVDKESGKLAIDWDDELIAATALTRDRKVIHPALVAASPAGKRAAKKPAAKKTAAKRSTTKKATSAKKSAPAKKAQTKKAQTGKAAASKPAETENGEGS